MRRRDKKRFFIVLGIILGIVALGATCYFFLLGGLNKIHIGKALKLYCNYTTVEGNMESYITLLPKKIQDTYKNIDKQTKDNFKRDYVGKTCVTEIRSKLSKKEKKDLEESYNKVYNSKSKISVCQNVIITIDGAIDEKYSCKFNDGKWYIFG